jgi:2,3-bisphosphoglycerate-independent phosphoglycerate mutase
VPSYDQKPEMSCKKITEAITKELKKKKTPDSVILNFANADLVGHSGNFKATVKAVETIDQCLKEIIPIALEKDYSIILTADHGNAEMMKYTNGEVCPSHSFNPVIFMLISNSEKNIKLRKGNTIGLKDIAPTILELMNIKQPKDMTGKSLIK